MANFICKDCGFTTNKIPDRYIGKIIKCPKCKGSGKKKGKGKKGRSKRF